MEEYDIEFHRYRALMESGGGAVDEGLLEVRRLRHLYQGHLRREQQLADAARSQDSSPLSQYYPKQKLHNSIWADKK